MSVADEIVPARRGLVLGGAVEEGLGVELVFQIGNAVESDGVRDSAIGVDVPEGEADVGAGVGLVAEVAVAGRVVELVVGCLVGGLENAEAGVVVDMRASAGDRDGLVEG